MKKSKISIIIFLFLSLISCKAIREHPKNYFQIIDERSIFNIKVVLSDDWSLEFLDRSNVSIKSEHWIINLDNFESKIYLGGYLHDREQDAKDSIESIISSIPRFKKSGDLGQEYYLASSVQVCGQEFQYYEYSQDGEAGLGPFTRVIDISFYNGPISYSLGFVIYEEEFEQLDQLKSDFWTFISRIECE
jgi:hypothetical protein